MERAAGHDLPMRTNIINEAQDGVTHRLMADSRQAILTSRREANQPRGPVQRLSPAVTKEQSQPILGEASGKAFNGDRWFEASKATREGKELVCCPDRRVRVHRRQITSKRAGAPEMD